MATAEGDLVTWLVIGARGQLGTDLTALLGHRAVGVDLPEIDITDPGSVRAVVDSVEPAVVVNCAAYTAVDAAETDPQTAEAVNGLGAANVAVAAARARVIQVSTDYVFDGRADAPYPEDAEPSPRSVYGLTKLHGEQAVLRHPDSYVVRTAWLYGATGKNFVKSMLALERTQPTVSVVDDQIGQPTWSRDLAAQIIALGDSAAAPGVYHATNAGQTSWFGLTRRIFDLIGADPARVLPTTTDRFPRPAPRPAYSALGHARWGEQGLPTMRPWDEALAEALPLIVASTQP